MSDLDLAPWIDWVVQLRRGGLAHVVCGAGSRSSPILEAFLSVRGLPIHVAVDERSAGYRALGIAQALGQPVAVLTTSGTAAANLLPACCEAWYAGVPLLLLTADRPPEWIGQEDNQAIEQRGLFGTHVGLSLETPLDFAHPDSRWHLARTARDAMHALHTGRPVHVNVPLREPLYAAPSEPVQAEQGEFLVHDTYNAESGFDEALARAERPLVLVGQSAQPPATTLPHSGELLSNLPDAAPPEFWIHQLPMPDLVITSGGAFVSKFLRQAIRASSAEHWHHGSDKRAEVFQRPTKLAPPGSLGPELAPKHQAYALALAESIESSRRKRDRWLAEQAAGELHAIRQLIETHPGATIHLGNSLAVRLACLVAEPQPGQRFFANRGTSGIDGSLSTALGHALAVPGRTHLAILGDLSFFYDRNALWPESPPPNLKIAVLNNDGGAIFRALPGPDRWPIEHWTTPHGLSARRTAEDHGLPYFTGDQIEAFASERSGLIEIVADGAQTADQFRALLALLKQS